ncbi:MAG: molybdopterin-binding protein [Thermoprotei archaeon]
MSAEILSTGYELLIGRVINSNAAYLGADLTKRGYSVRRIVCVGDDMETVGMAVRESLSRKPSVLVCTGGLGPTFDDLTATSVAWALETKVTLNASAAELIAKRYSAMGLPVTDERLKMAMLPYGCEILVNEVGTAPGFAVKAGSSWVVCMPGVPSEMKAMWTTYGDRYAPKVGSLFETSFEIMGVPESSAAPLIAEFMSKNPYLYIKSHPKGKEQASILEIHVYAMGSDQRLKDKVEEVAGGLRQSLEAMSRNR